MRLTVRGRKEQHGNWVMDSSVAMMVTACQRPLHNDGVEGAVHDGTAWLSVRCFGRGRGSLLSLSIGHGCARGARTGTTRGVIG